MAGLEHAFTASIIKLNTSCWHPFPLPLRGRNPNKIHPPARGRVREGVKGRLVSRGCLLYI
jgi:hypothetical protein